jgi:hypothetical protein
LTIRRLLEGISENKTGIDFARLIACHDITIECLGSQRLPFVGCWLGWNGLDDWFQSLYSLCEVEHWNKSAKCAVDESVAFAEIETRFKKSGEYSPPVELVLRLDLEHCQIQRLHLNVDSAVIQDFYTAPAPRSG